MATVRIYMKDARTDFPGYRVGRTYDVAPEVAEKLVNEKLARIIPANETPSEMRTAITKTRRGGK